MKIGVYCKYEGKVLKDKLGNYYRGSQKVIQPILKGIHDLN